jgi:hypothetical protein
VLKELPEMAAQAKLEETAVTARAALSQQQPEHVRQPCWRFYKDYMKDGIDTGINQCQWIIVHAYSYKYKIGIGFVRCILYSCFVVHGLYMRYL